MKIVLVAPTFLPARRANTIQVMKMAQAISDLGHDLQVLAPSGQVAFQPPAWDDLSQQYGLEQRFKIDWLPTNYRLRSYDYGLKSVHRAVKANADLIYTRLPQCASIASLIGMPTIYEIHDLPQGKLGPLLFKCFLRGSGARALVVITDALREAVNHKFGADFNKGTGSFIRVLTAPDGVDLARYANVPSPQVARRSIFSSNFINTSPIVVGYTGHLYSGRGANLILDVAAQIPDLAFLLVGGESKDVSRFRHKIQERGFDNLTLIGFIPNANLSQYQAACDILLMPYQHKVEASSGGDISKYLSPMKLFEYMACGRAIISSDLPVLREILNEKNAILLPPDDVDAWVAAIQDLRSHPGKRAHLAAQARLDSKQYSWKTRAQKILFAIESDPRIAKE
jgi:glycosyltransferase involved in cell wall biosynthesis